MVELARFKVTKTEGVEKLDWYWVVGPLGAVSTWFSDTRSIIGRAVCSGLAWHSPRPWGAAEHHGPCGFIESECWSDCGSLLALEPQRLAFEAGDDEAIYAWLTDAYSELGQAPTTTEGGSDG